MKIWGDISNCLTAPGTQIEDRTNISFQTINKLIYLCIPWEQIKKLAYKFKIVSNKNILFTSIHAYIHVHTLFAT